MRHRVTGYAANVATFLSSGANPAIGRKGGRTAGKLENGFHGRAQLLTLRKTL